MEQAPEGLARLGLAPVLDRQTKIVILGSFPSEASLTLGAYYGNPRNQFWRLLSGVLNEDLVSLSYPGRVARLLAKRIGLWDALLCCDRRGSLDATIRNAHANHLSRLTEDCDGLALIVLNGAAAARHAKGRLPNGVRSCQVPSSSPAHALLSLSEKMVLWRQAFGLVADDVL